MSRKDIEKYLQEEIRTGDILFRSSNAKFHGIPFSKLVQFLTRSRYSHASIALREGDNIILVEINDLGTHVMSLQEWLNYYPAMINLAVMRLKKVPDGFYDEMASAIKDFIELKPEYDFTFTSEDKFYCTESVVHIYRQVGIEISDGYTPKEVLAWWVWPIFYVCNALVGVFTKGSIPLDSKSYFVGNEKQGMLASSVLDKIFEI